MTIGGVVVKEETSSGSGVTEVGHHFHLTQI